MSQEPEKEIEKQLRAHAEQRRAEAAAQLGTGPHPATRKLLHGEIGRTYGPAPVAQKATKPWWSYWPGFAFAGGLAAVLMLVFANRPAEETAKHMAKADALATSPTPVAAPAAAAPPAAPVALAAEVTEVRKDMSVTAAAPAAPPPVLNPEPAAKLGGTLRGGSSAAAGAAPAASQPADRMDMAKAEADKPQLKVFANRSRQFEQTELRPTADATKQSMDRGNSRSADLKDSAPFASTAAPLPAAPSAPPATGIPMAAREALASNGTASKPAIPAKRVAITAPAAAPTMTTTEGYITQNGVVAVEQKKQAAQRPVSNGAYFANKLVSDSESNEARVPQSPNQAALRKNFQSPPRPAVLTQFQVEQNGNEVRFIDQDGSVYVGQMGGAADEAAPLAEAEKAADKKEAVKTKAFEAQSNLQNGRQSGGLGGGQNAQFFRASGLNLTLNQNVVISGEFVNSLAIAGKKLSPTNYSVSTAMPDGKAKATVLPPTQIQGRVQIGERQEIILNAVPMGK
jgi:hypothetical protein